MSLTKTWYTLDEAEAKFGVERKCILRWVEEGIVRSEGVYPQVDRVNSDDLELKINERD
jgi:hypothetical protein